MFLSFILLLHYITKSQEAREAKRQNMKMLVSPLHIHADLSVANIMPWVDTLPDNF